MDECERANTYFRHQEISARSCKLGEEYRGLSGLGSLSLEIIHPKITVGLFQHPHFLKILYNSREQSDSGSSIVVTHRAGGAISGVRFSPPRHFDSLRSFSVFDPRQPQFVRGKPAHPYKVYSKVIIL